MTPSPDRPSPRAERLLRVLARDHPSVDFLIGDLREEFCQKARHRPLRARWWHWGQVVRLGLRLAAMRLFARRGRQTASPRRRENGWARDGFDDLRYAVRSLRKRPGLAVVAVSTLALGIGPTTSVFTLTKTVLLGSLPFPEPNELVFLWTENDDSGDRHNSSGPNVRDWREQADAFEGLYAFINEELVMTGPDGTRERIPVLRASHEIFDVLGLPPVVGRAFGSEEVGRGRAPVVLLGHGFWLRRFASDPSVVGESLVLSGIPHEIVGVASPHLDVPMSENAELILPIDFEMDERPRDYVYLGAAARLRDGVSFTDAHEQMKALHASIREAYPAETVGTSVALVPMSEELVGDARAPLLILMAATGLLLALASANVANLWLARGTERESELALRFALGANRSRVLRLLLTESLLISLGAGLGGVVLAAATLRGLLALAPVSLPRIENASVDFGVLAFASALTLVTGLAFGIVPALTAMRMGRVDPTRGAVSPRRLRRAQGVLVAAQCGGATLLLVGAGLLARSFVNLLAVDPGYHIESVITANIALPPDVYPEREGRGRLFQTVEREAKALPGVTAAGVTLIPPLEETRINFEIRVEGRAAGKPGSAPSADLGIASWGYFDVLEIPLLAGRGFGDEDRHDAPKVCVVSALLAGQLWSQDTALGKRIDLVAGDWDEAPEWLEVVGVVSDVKQKSLSDPERPFVYLPVSQLPQTRGSLIVRSEPDVNPTFLSGAVRELVRSVDPRIPVPEIGTMEERLNETLSSPRFNMTLLSFLGLLALALAASGTYGVLSYLVASRTPEMGVRVSFGARERDIHRLVLSEGLTLSGLGVAGGLTIAALASHLLESLLFGVSATDAVTFGLVPAGLMGVVACACLVPARRASRIDPASALRR